MSTSGGRKGLGWHIVAGAILALSLVLGLFAVIVGVYETLGPHDGRYGGGRGAAVFIMFGGALAAGSLARIVRWVRRRRRKRSLDELPVAFTREPPE